MPPKPEYHFANWSGRLSYTKRLLHASQASGGTHHHTHTHLQTDRTAWLGADLRGAQGGVSFGRLEGVHSQGWTVSTLLVGCRGKGEDERYMLITYCTERSLILPLN